MAIDKVGSVAGATASPALAGGQERFSALLKAGRSAGPPVAPEGGLPAVSPDTLRALPGAQHAQTQGCAPPGRLEAQALRPAARVAGAEAAQWVDRVSQAQRRLDHILHLAESGKSFSPVELLSFQAHVYRASQELDLAGKVVEKATGGVKQVLQTQL